MDERGKLRALKLEAHRTSPADLKFVDRNATQPPKLDCSKTLHPIVSVRLQPRCRRFTKGNKIHPINPQMSQTNETSTRNSGDSKSSNTHEVEIGHIAIPEFDNSALEFNMVRETIINGALQSGSGAGTRQKTDKWNKDSASPQSDACGDLEWETRGSYHPRSAVLLASAGPSTLATGLFGPRYGGPFPPGADGSAW